MPNLFVSLPMRGRDEIDIRNEMEDLCELAEEEYGVEFDLMDTYEHGNPPDDILHGNMWYLAKSIEMLTQANFVIFAPGWKNASGCIVEHMICALYDIPYAELHVPEIPNLENAEVIMDYTHDLDEQPVEIVDKIDILHKDDNDSVDSMDNIDDSINGNESLAEPEFDDEDYLEPGEYDADINIPDLAYKSLSHKYRKLINPEDDLDLQPLDELDIPGLDWTVDADEFFDDGES